MVIPTSAIAFFIYMPGLSFNFVAITAYLGNGYFAS
jgi:hypothetical protein